MAAKSTGSSDRLGLHNVVGAARDAHRLVADALQVAIDLDHRQDEAQIDGHGLFLGQQLVGHLVQFTLRGVDGRLVLLHVLAQALVALQIGVHRGLDRLLRQRSHGKELVLEFGELQLKVNTRHGRFSPNTIVHQRHVTGRQISPERIPV